MLIYLDKAYHIRKGHVSTDIFYVGEESLLYFFKCKCLFSEGSEFVLVQDNTLGYSSMSWVG